MYTNGFAHTENNNNIDLEKRHAWTVAKIDGKWLPLDATWNIFNGKLHLGDILRYYGVNYRETKVDWGVFLDILSTNEEKLKLDPSVSLKITALSFLSRELEDDDEGDFDITFNDYSIYIYIIIISSVIIAFILAICFMRLIKRKRIKENEGLLKQRLIN